MINLSRAECFDLIPSGGMNLDAALPSSISYDPLSKRFRDNSTGIFISRADSISLQQKFLGEVTKKFVSLAPRIIAGEIGVAKEAGILLKQIHLSQAIIKANGIDRLSNSDLGMIGNVLKKQYGKGIDRVTGKPFGLKYLFKEIQGNPGYSETRLKSRLEMYAQSGEISGNIVEQNQAKTQGQTEMKRHLGQSQHCVSCEAYAAAGWQPIGALPLPMIDCQCKNNCKCFIEYR